jgi:hypothetical protein
MEDLQNKDRTIREIWNVILTRFGDNFFAEVNFWDDDNYALGFRRDGKLIYISTWDFRQNKVDGIRCFSEFELIDEFSFETKETIKRMNAILLHDLLDEIKKFMNS